MRIGLIWNERAGSTGSVDAETVQRRLEATLGADVIVERISSSRSALMCTRAALDVGATLVVAAGGDGTVSGVAAEVVAARRSGREVTLGVLPLGTSNSFAAALGIPSALDEALALLATEAAEATEQRRVVDVAVVRGGAGERTMILHCTIGFHAAVIGETETAAKQRWGVLAYAATALRRLASLDTFALEVADGDHVLRCRATALIAANLAPIKTVLAQGPSHVLGDDGLVDITIVAAGSISEALATGLHLWRTARDAEPATRDNVGSLSAARVTVTADPPQHVLVDGEQFGETPVTIESVHHALRVVAPPAPEAEGPPVEAALLGLPDVEID